MPFLVARESVADKAARLLKERRLTVERADTDGGWVVAHCRGDTGDYSLGWDPKVGEWRCSCPNVKGDCSHIAALKMIVIR